MHQCPKCGKFVKKVIAYFDGFDQIKRVEARCHSHGKVEIEDWIYDEFFPEAYQ